MRPGRRLRGLPDDLEQVSEEVTFARRLNGESAVDEAHIGPATPTATYGDA